MDEETQPRRIQTVRCKFKCQSVAKRIGWNAASPFLYEADFSAVMDGSEENKAFFAATPSGSLKVGTVKVDVFEVGKEYYLDITPAD